MMMKVEVRHVKSNELICSVDKLTADTSVLQLKHRIKAQKPKYYPDRQQLKLSQDKRAKAVKNDDTLSSLGITDDGVIYFKDLGTQIGWTTVFFSEYAGPLVTYLLFYLRPSLVYGPDAAFVPTDFVVKLALVCWTVHYLKRIFETLCIHRFSHATMPIFNLFKNCGYYWSFAGFISYYINHPLYTPPCFGAAQIFAGLSLFIVCEYGNYAIHVALRDLRTPGTKQRKVPMPTSNPMTQLFNFVSCPNYTYEAGAWIGFSIMTQSVPALLFTAAGFLQMTLWAQGKHKNYLREFLAYPRARKAILPFIL